VYSVTGTPTFHTNLLPTSLGLFTRHDVPADSSSQHAYDPVNPRLSTRYNNHIHNSVEDSVEVSLENLWRWPRTAPPGT